MAHLGYARVSTAHQALDQQLDALRAAGVERIFEDKMTGTREDRPGLSSLLDYAREGDTVTVAALDRLGRSLSGVINTVEDLRNRGILIRSLREGIDYSTSVGRMVAGIFAALAEYEHTLINERAAAARTAARARGRSPGRKRVMDQSRMEAARILRAKGQTVAEISATLGVGRSTLYRAWELDGDPRA
jgi:DNA invertase Pin-like site-specific DNA recombinase